MTFRTLTGAGLILASLIDIAVVVAAPATSCNPKKSQ